MDRAFRVGPWTIEPRLGVFRRDDGTSLRVRTKVMDLLVFFAQHPGEVLTKDALLDGVWQTEAISESSLTRTMTELRQALEDDAERPTILETIPKRGYRLIAPVSRVESIAPATSPAPVASRITNRRIGALAAIVVLLVSVGSAIAWRSRDNVPATRLSFKPRDLVLITRFENKTGDTVLDGAVEYALERELTMSGVVGLVAAARVDDALRLMKKPIDTVIDREIGREVCLRDGGIKVMVTGRIEKYGTRYVLTTQLVDPIDGTIVTSVTDQASADDEILSALSRSASRVREALGERLHVIRGPTAATEKVSTVSLRAFQLYSQAHQLARQGKWNGALELSRQAVEIDPEFASGWNAVAWALYRNQAPMRDIHMVAERAVALTGSVADWERHWILGSYGTFSGDYATAARSYEALVAIRPDHVEAVNNLQVSYTALGKAEAALDARKRLADLRPHDIDANYMAAWSIVGYARSVDEAQPYINRLRILLGDSPAATDSHRAGWLAVLPAYRTWASGDVRAALQQVEEAVRSLPRQPQPGWRNVASLLANFYLSVGRLDDADRLFAEAQDVGQRAIVAELADDTASMRKWLLRLNNPEAMRVERFVKAGLLDVARELLDSDRAVNANEGVILAKPLGRGYLALAEGRPDLAVPYLQQHLAISKNMFDASYYSGCEGLATAFARLRRMQDAIDTLEPCAARQPPYVGIFAGAAWLQLKMHLADHYRKVGRVADAIAVERTVRAYLVVADDDHPLLVRLRQREQAHNQAAP